ncbi:MAG: hypothetical protein V1773_18920 [bacterium]
MDSTIHPKLKVELIAMKYLRIAFPIIGIVIFGAISFVFIQQISAKQISVINSVLLLAGGFLAAALFFGLSFLIRRQEASLNKANNILLNTKPEKKVLNNSSIVSFSGAIYYLTDGFTEETKNAKFISLSTSKNKVPKKPPVEVNYYSNPNIDSKIIIIDDTKNIFIGSIKAKEQAITDLKKTIKFTPYFSGLLALIPIILLFVLWHQISESREFEKYINTSLTWQSVQGEIIQSKIKTVKIKRNKKDVNGFKAEVKYAYTIDNNPFVGDIISLDYSASTDIKDAKDIVNTFTKDKVINVFYDSHNNNISYLLPANLDRIKSRNKTLLYTLVIVILVFIVIAVVFLFVFRRSNKKQKLLLQSLENDYK